MSDIKDKINDIYESGKKEKSKEKSVDENMKEVEEAEPVLKDDPESDYKTEDALDSETQALLDKATKVLTRDKIGAEKFKETLQALIAEYEPSIKDKIQNLG